MTRPTDPASYPESAIAVIGMAVRVPGAPDVQRFWDNLVAGVESVTIGPAPDDHIAAAGVLDGVELFDAAFFGIPAGEAAELDPQHRLFLECAWSALEAAGHGPGAAPIRAGVYGGATYSTYLMEHLMPDAAARGASARDNVWGFARDFLAMRVAYKLGLTGPAMTIQTGCSTSLVAIHVACQALIAGECELALAGGVGLSLPQLAPYRYHEGGIRSADGHCRAFDIRGTGTVAGNGAGVIVLRRLADALADRDPIRAVVLGTALNNDGSAKAGFAAPSVDGQARAIREALDIAGVAATDISYVEAHGTATPLGDPVELAALKQAFAGAPRASCGIGSVKTNLGHLDAAAGVVAVIKTALALEHRVLPASLHFTAPNPQLGIEDSPFYVVAERQAWTGPAPLRAGVSGFGIGGTNAHLVMEQPPVPDADPPRRGEELLVISAKTATALDRATGELADVLRTGDAPLADLAHTLQVGRARFAVRRFAVGSDRHALADALAGTRHGGARAGRDASRNAEDRDAVFVFPGSGAQRVHMAAELRGEAGFAAAFDDCAGRARALLGLDLRRVVFPGPDEHDAMAQKLDDPVVSQTAIFACSWAIAQQWLAWGVAPRALLGHSLGEYAAACLAGVFSLDDALRIVVERGRILERLPPSGMTSVLASVEQVAPQLDAGLSISAINGAGTCVVAGPIAALARLEAALAAAGVELRRLRFARATHTPLLDPHLAAFERLVAAARPRAPTLRMVSAVTGTWLAPAQATDPAYWRRQFRDTVRFGDALSTLLSSGRRAVIEAGPGSALSALVRQHPAAAGHAVVTTAPGPSSAAPSRRALDALGEAWVAGVAIDWQRFRGDERRRRVPLPTYSFDRERHWIDAAPDAPSGPGRRAVAAPARRAQTRAQISGPTRAADPARNDTERGLVACFEELFHTEPIGIHDDFFELGGDSLLALRLTALIARRLDVRLAIKALVEAPTIAQLAARIAEPRSAAAERASCLVRLQTGAPAAPVFFVHAGGGHAVFYRDLARAIDPDRLMYGFEARGLDGVEPLHASVEDMASHYVELARAVHRGGPYLLVGASFGGMIAYEMARQLAAAGHEVPLCALIDAPGPGYLPDAASDDASIIAAFAARPVGVARDQLRGRPLDAQLQLLLDEARRTGTEIAFSDLAAGRRMMRIWRNNFDAMWRYPAPPWPDGEVQFFAATERDDFLPPHLPLAWIGRCVVRVELASGGHDAMVRAPHAAGLGARIRSCIAARTSSMRGA